MRYCNKTHNVLDKQTVAYRSKSCCNSLHFNKTKKYGPSMKHDGEIITLGIYRFLTLLLAIVDMLLY